MAINPFASIQSNPLGAVGTVAGSFLPFPGGSALGGFLGSTVGKLFGFGDKKPEQFHLFSQIDPVTGKLLQNASNINGPQNQQLLDQMSNYYMAGLTPVQQLLQRLQAPIAGGPLNIGAFRGAVGYGGPSYQITQSQDYERTHDLINAGSFVGTPGDRLSVPTPELFGQAYNSLLGDLYSRSITGANLTNNDVLSRLGLPTDVAQLRSRLPSWSYGNDFDLSAPASLSLADVMALSGSPTGGFGGPSGTIAPLTGQAKTLYDTYQQMAPQLGAPNQGIPSYYRRG